MKKPIFLLFLFIATPANCESLIPSFWTTKSISTLEINTENTYKGRVNKCEKEGMLDLYRLKSPFEEFWAFIPSACIWIELGILEKVGNSIRKDRSGHCHPPNTISGINKNEVIVLIKRVESLTLYHQHPTNHMLVEHIAKIKGLDNFSETCLKNARTETLASALPSLPDLSSMLEFSRIFFKYHPNGKFSEKFISAYGVTEYFLTSVGHSKLGHDRFKYFQHNAMKNYFHLRKQIPNHLYKAHNSRKRNIEKLKYLQELINAEIKLFNISFKPKN